MNTPKISVVMPAFNAEKFIKTAIKSILGQTFKDFEFLIINDGSTDKTLEIIEKFKEQDQRIILISRGKRGLIASLNEGISLSKGQYIARMDADDIATPEKLNIQLNYLIKNPTVDLVGSNIMFFTHNKVRGVSDLKLYKQKNINFYLKTIGLPHPTWMVRTVFFKKFKYDPRAISVEDQDLLLRAQQSCKFTLLKEPLLFYRISEKNDSRYKITQVYQLFLSRIRNILHNKLFYYFPIVLIGLLASSIFYFFGYRPIKIKSSFNLEYQNIFDKITNNTQITVVNIISSLKGGGAETIINELDKIYSSKGINSYVIYFSGQYDSTKKNYFFLDLNPRNPISIFYLRKIFKKILNTTNKEVVIHAHLTWPFFFTVLAVLGLKNIKLFFTEHSTTNNRRKIPFFYLFDRLFYSNYLKIVCISQGVYEKLVKWVGFKIKKRLKIIYNGSRLYSLSKRTRTKNQLPKLISVGRLITIKNFSTTITAISKIKDDIESYTIIGEGPEQQKLETLIKSLKLENKVKLIGWKENIQKYFHKADIQLIPSLNEGFGLVAAEGMSTGLPVVASNIQGLTEVLGYQNLSITLVSEIDSSKEWAEKIYESINNLDIHGSDKIAKFSKQQVEKFTFNKMANEYLNMYSKN
jgi:glycosyltransferase involved in cell wall biosynthesis